MSPKPLYKVGDIATITDGPFRGYTCQISADEPYQHVAGWIYFVEIHVKALTLKEVVMERTLAVDCSRKNTRLIPR